VVNHYKSKLEEARKTWRVKPTHLDGAPYIFGPFNNWEPAKMTKAVDFCEKNDPKKPDFLQDCINIGTISYEAAENPKRMTPEEKEIVS